MSSKTPNKAPPPAHMSRENPSESRLKTGWALQKQSAREGARLLGGLAWFSLAVRLARRELRSGISGFRIFLLCLAIGVAAIAAVGSLSQGIIAGLQADGRALLGGDLALQRIYEPIPSALTALLEEVGTRSRSAELRAMSRDEAGAATLVELKAVDGLYPLIGQVRFSAYLPPTQWQARNADYGPTSPQNQAKAGLGPEESSPAPPPVGATLPADLQPAFLLHQLLAPDANGVPGLVAEPLLLNRQNLALGAHITIGTQRYELRAVIAREPDRAGAGGFALGPRAMVALNTLTATGLVQPGSQIYWHDRLRVETSLGPDTGPVLAALQQRIRQDFPKPDWRWRDLQDATPRLKSFLDRLGQFLTLVGLTALVVGGVGVASAVRGFLDSRLANIATMKCLGAPYHVVMLTYFLQILVMALLAIGLGVILGAIAPLLLARLIPEEALPISAKFAFYPTALLQAGLFGLLTAFSFSLWPLGRAGQVPAGALFRDKIIPTKGRPSRFIIGIQFLAGLALAVMALAIHQDWRLSLGFVGGTLAAMALLLGLGRLIIFVVARLPRPSRPVVALALGNMHRPGNLTSLTILSLGLGLTVLVTMAQVEGNFARQIEAGRPQAAPSFFMLDIQQSQIHALREQSQRLGGAEGFAETPFLRGTIINIKGKDAQAALIDENEGWLLRGDRGVTYSALPPPGAQITAGTWWSSDYRGPLLVSVAQDMVDGFGVGLGDDITVRVLGRDLTAKIASIRQVDWSSMGMNFVLVFSPGLLDKAPHSYLATLKVPPAQENAAEKLLVGQFPNVSVVRISDTIASVNEILAKIGLAVRAAAAVTLLVGTLVLAGAIAAGQQRRIFDAVVLKVLGATRPMLWRSFLLEYCCLALASSMVAALAGTIASWAILVFVLKAEWVFLPLTVIKASFISLIAVILLGFIGDWRVLSKRPAPYLRHD
jgi:putative ABC transport system permease protein